MVQVPAFRMVPRFEVAALCSRRPDSVEAAGEKLGISDVSTDWKAFVERDDLDVISVCTPVDLHHEQALAAIAAGKHVLVEKPVGLDSTQTGEMLAAAEAAGVCHAVCFELRWEPSRLKIWEMVRAGYLGHPYLALARSGADFWHPTRGLQSEWMYKRSEGGGYLMGMGSHDIDYLCALFGEPEAVCADVRNNVPKRQRADGSTLDVDADDLGAEVGQHHAGKRPRPDPGEFDDAHPGEWTGIPVVGGRGGRWGSRGSVHSCRVCRSLASDHGAPLRCPGG